MCRRASRYCVSNTAARHGDDQKDCDDRENRYAVTASDDKTARVWSLPDGRLLGVLRVPIGDGNMGKLFAVAMTPDGNTVALGGWTAARSGAQDIYLLDRILRAHCGRRLLGLRDPNVVNHLAYFFWMAASL